MVTGVSFGAYHAANFALRHAHLFPLAICQSGVYDVSVVAGGERGDAVYFNNPGDYVHHLGGDHLDWLRGHVNLLLIAGQGQWEDTTGALESTQTLRGAARREGDPPRARPLGPRLAARLAGVARPDRASSPPLPMSAAHAPDRPAARHRGGLAARLRAPARAGRPDRARRRDARADDRADHERAVRPALEAALLARDRPPRLVVHGAARVAEEGLADGRRLPAEQPVHVPGDGEALGLLRDDAARPERAGDVADPAQEPARERALPADRRALQPSLRPRGDRGEGRLPALHEAVRRRPVGRRHAHPRRDGAARRLRHLRRAADAPAGVGRGLRRLRPQPLDRGRDDGDALRARPADVRPLPGRPRLPLRRDRRRGGHDQPARERLLPLGVQLVRDDRQGRRRLADRLRERLPGRRAHQPALLLPLGDPRARPLDARSARRPAGRCGSTRRPATTSRSATATTSPTRRSSPSTAASPTTTSRSPSTTSSAPRSWRTSTRLLVDWVEGPGFDGLLVDTVTSTFPQHEHEHFVAHYRGLLAAWATDQRAAA